MSGPSSRPGYRPLLPFAVLLAMALTPGHAARAAFEWEHATPRSLVVGDSPLRWPADGDGRGLRVDVAGARPWSWPGVGAAAFRLGLAGRERVFGASFSELWGPAYRESRLTAAVEHALGSQRLGAGASVLEVTAGEGRSTRRGAELDLAWEIRLPKLSLAARAAGALQSGGARDLGAPQLLALSARVTALGLVAGLELEEGSLGRRLRLGLLIKALDPLDVGAAWSSAGSPVRLAVGLQWGDFTFGSGWACHPDLPTSQMATLSFATTHGDAADVPGSGHRSGKPR